MNLQTIQSWDDVPLFDSEQAEADFWAENQVDQRLMELSATASSEQSESVTITLRMDPRMLSRIKRFGPFPVPQLPEHDQTMVERAHGKGIEGPLILRESQPSRVKP